jgi:hypothetical protein
VTRVAAVRDANRGDAGVLERERPAAPRVLRLQAPSLLGDILAGIDLGEPGGARSQRLALVEKMLDQDMPLVALGEARPR